MKNWYLIFPFSGPDAWHNNFPVAIEGKRQSPIDIETSNIIDGSSVTSSKPLTWSYQKDHCLNIENTGASWKVNVNGTGSCKFINWYLLTANRGLLRLYWSSCCSSAISQSLLVIIRMFLIFFYLESILFSFIGYFSNWNIFLFLIGIFSFLSILKQACLIETFSFFWIGTSNLL